MADRIKRLNLKLYATLDKVGLKGPAFYAYVERRSVPSDEVVPKIISLALALDRDGAIKIVQEELRGLAGFVDQLLRLAPAGISAIDQILASIFGVPRKKKRREG